MILLLGSITRSSSSSMDWQEVSVDRMSAIEDDEISWLVSELTRHGTSFPSEFLGSDSHLVMLLIPQSVSLVFMIGVAAYMNKKRSKCE